MPQKSVDWLTTVRLACMDCPGSAVILCITPELIAQKICPDTEAVPPTEFPWKTIEGQLLVVKRITDSCARVLYRYTFTYESTQLTDDAVLNSGDILGVLCDGCLADFVRDEAGNDVDLRSNDDGSLTLVNQHNCEFTFTPGTAVTVADTDSVDLTMVAGQITADVNISADEGNIISIHGDGLFAEAPAASEGWLITGNSGTVDGTNFCGTLDDVAFDVRVNNTRVRRSEPDALCNLIIDGAADNNAAGSGCGILSGGISENGFNPNFISEGYFSVIGGGSGNFMEPDASPAGDGFDAGFSVICGGFINFIQMDVGKEPWDSGSGGFFQGGNFIGGGFDNFVITSDYGTIGGGSVNFIEYDVAGSDLVAENYIYGDAIAGGVNNYCLGDASWVSQLNLPYQLGMNSIVGGESNSVEGGVHCGVASGWQNSVTGYNYDDRSLIIGWQQASFVGSGIWNVIIGGQRSAIVSGGDCSLIGEDSSVILGGYLNRIEATSPVQSVNASSSLAIPDPPNSAGVGNVILGGVANQIVDGHCSSVLGGAFLKIGTGSIAYQCPSTRNFTAVDGADRDGFNERIEAAQVDVSAFSNIDYRGDVDVWVGNTDSTARKVKFFEPNADLDFSSTNYSSIEAQDQSANIEYVLPAAAGTAGQSLKIQGVVGNVVTLEWA